MKLLEVRNKLSSINKNIREGAKKEDFRSEILSINEALESYFKKEGFTLKDKRVSILGENIDQRLEEARALLLSSDVKKSIPQTMNWIAETVDYWWEDIGFSYVSKCCMNERGVVHIELTTSPDLTPFSMSKSPDSDRELKKKKHKDLIEKTGFIFKKGEYTGIDLEDLDYNKIILREIIEEAFGSVGNIKYICNFGAIDSLSFTIRDLTVFENIRKEKEEVAPITTIDILTTDDVAVLKDAISSFTLSIAMVETSDRDFLKETIYPLFVSYFSEIAEIMGIETSLSAKLDKQSSKIRSKSLELRAINEKIKESKDLTSCKKNIIEIAQNTKLHIAKETNLSLEGFEISNYEYTKVRFRWLSSDCSWYEDEPLEIDWENIKAEWDLAIEGTRFNTYHELKLTDRNQKNIIDRLESLNIGFRLESIKTLMKRTDLTITEVIGNISNWEKFVDLGDDK